MQLRTMVSVLGEVFGWYPAQSEYISTIQRDGRREIVRSRIAAKAWNWFLEGINVRLLRELNDIKESGSPDGSIEAVINYRGGTVNRVVLSWDSEENKYTVKSTADGVIEYKTLDRAMHMFSLKLETLMKERMLPAGI